MGDRIKTFEFQSRLFYALLVNFRRIAGDNDYDVINIIWRARISVNSSIN